MPSTVVKPPARKPKKTAKKPEKAKKKQTCYGRTFLEPKTTLIFVSESCPDPGSRIQITTHTFPFQALFIKPAKADPKFENSLDPGSWILVLDFDMQDSFDEAF